MNDTLRAVADATTHRYPCTAAAPWSPEKGARATHPDAVEVDSCSDECCAIYLCPNCQKRFRSELPQ